MLKVLHKKASIIYTFYLNNWSHYKCYVQAVAHGEFHPLRPQFLGVPRCFSSSLWFFQFCLISNFCDHNRLFHVKTPRQTLCTWLLLHQGVSPSVRHKAAILLFYLLGFAHFLPETNDCICLTRGSTRCLRDLPLITNVFSFHFPSMSLCRNWLQPPRGGKQS